MYRRIARKPFFITLFLKQNNHHRYSVLGHTCKLAWLVLKDGRYDFLAAALLHDVGKPLVAYQDEKDKTTGEYSFTNHEEISYHIIKHWPLISQTTKALVRYHYAIRGMQKAKEKGQMGKYKRIKRQWERLVPTQQQRIKEFMHYDDLAKR